MWFRSMRTGKEKMPYLIYRNKEDASWHEIQPV